MCHQFYAEKFSSLVTYVDTSGYIALPTVPKVQHVGKKNATTIKIHRIRNPKKNVDNYDDEDMNDYDEDVGDDYNNDDDDHDDYDNYDDDDDHDYYDDDDDDDLLPAVRRQVEGEHCQKGDSHAGDNQVHLHHHHRHPACADRDGDDDGGGDGGGGDDGPGCADRDDGFLWGVPKYHKYHAFTFLLKKAKLEISGTGVKRPSLFLTSFFVGIDVASKRLM